MRILHVNEHYGSLGGAERYLADICEALAARGLQPVVLASTRGPASGDEASFRVHRLEPSFGLRSSRRAAAALKRVVEQERPHVIHLHNIQFFLGPALLRNLLSGVPAIMTAHDVRTICPRWQSKIIPGADALCGHPLGRHCFLHGCYPFHLPPASAVENLQKFLLVCWQLALSRRLDRVLVSSAYMQEQFRLNGFPADRLERLPMFMRDGFAPLAEKASGPPRIVYAGRIDEQKGFRQFLACLAQIATPAWTAQVAGTGPFLPEALTIAARLGLTDRIEFLGELPSGALARVLGSARVLVMPSYMPESFGLAGLEALACGTPVVAFDSGGIAEWLQHGVTGFLVPWGDVATLAQRVRQLLEDETLAGELGRNGARHARRYSREKHVDRLCEVYAEVAASRSPEAAAGTG